MVSGVRARRGFLAAGVIVAAVLAAGAVPAAAASGVAVSGSGSTWAQGAVDQWRRGAADALGLTVNYSGVGSRGGLADFERGSADFAVSETPLPRASDGAPLVTRDHVSVPLLAGGTALAYNLTVDGTRVTNLRLSGSTLAGIFSGAITRWDDAQLRADNPGIALPDLAIIPVVRADDSASSAQFTAWMASEHPGIWTHGVTSLFPRLSSAFRAQSGSLGISGYVAQSYARGAITYVEAAYAVRSGLSVAAMQNAAGAYVTPGSANVSAALAGAQIDQDPSTPGLTGVYRNADPAAYPLSAYASLLAPTAVGAAFTAQKGATLAAFARYTLCEGGPLAEAGGDAPLPPTLVAIGLAEVARIPGADPSTPDCGTATSDPTSASIGVWAPVVGGLDGPLSLSLPSAARAALSDTTVVDGMRVSSGTLPLFTVEDARAASRPGYTVQITTTDFLSGSTRMPASALEITPQRGPGTADSLELELAPPFAASTDSAVFASADVGSGAGRASFTAILRLRVPADAPAGTYRSTTTLTVVSR